LDFKNEKKKILNTFTKAGFPVGFTKSVFDKISRVTAVEDFIIVIIIGFIFL